MSRLDTLTVESHMLTKAKSGPRSITHRLTTRATTRDDVSPSLRCC